MRDQAFMPIDRRRINICPRFLPYRLKNIVQSTILCVDNELTITITDNRWLRGLLFRRGWHLDCYSKIQTCSSN